MTNRPNPDSTEAPDDPVAEFVALYDAGRVTLETHTIDSNRQLVPKLDTDNKAVTWYEHTIKNAAIDRFDEWVDRSTFVESPDAFDRFIDDLRAEVE